MPTELSVPLAKKTGHGQNCREYCGLHHGLETDDAVFLTKMPPPTTEITNQSVDPNIAELESVGILQPSVLNRR